MVIIITTATPRQGRANRGKFAGVSSTVIAQFLLQINNQKMFYLKNEGQSDGSRKGSDMVQFNGKHQNR